MNMLIKTSITKTQIMKNKLFFCLPALFFALALNSCKKIEKTYNTNFPNATDPGGTLKDASNINIGAAIDFSPTINDASYLSLVKQEFDGVTFSYNMKHGAIVKGDGSLDFTDADAMMSKCTGLTVFGHSLGWYQNQNADFLNRYAGLVSSDGPELLPDPSFEQLNAPNQLAHYYTYNSGNPAGTSSITYSTAEKHSGSSSMKVVNPVGYGGDQWRVQVASDAIATIPGKVYNVSYWVKATGSAGSIRLSTQDNTGNAFYQGDVNIGTDWQIVTWSFTAGTGGTQTKLFFDMGRAANTYYVDDASIKSTIAANTDPAAVYNKLDTALNTFVTGMVNHYKISVKVWDVINELFADNGTVRNNANSPAAGSDYFVWSNYMGNNFALNAFKYAALADPTATLFINDYALESNPVKLDSLISYVTWLKSQGAKVDGIGTQMHITSVTRHDGIDSMMQKLGATGLMVRISELDVKTNIAGTAPYILTPLDAFGQEEMYKYVINSYKKYIPKAQQYGITVWGVSDDKSWLYNGGKDFPLLFNGDYTKKSTYAAALTALKAQ
jgi:endo-1,4-beta-xylanase